MEKERFNHFNEHIDTFSNAFWNYIRIAEKKNNFTKNIEKTGPESIRQMQTKLQ